MTMGVDIHGWIEIRRYGHWYSVLDIRALVDRNDEIRDCLFGACGVGFASIAEGRGVPDDLGELCKKEYYGRWADGYGHTWISAKELEEINWEEKSKELDEQLHEYRLSPDGKRRVGCMVRVWPDKELNDYKSELAGYKQVQIRNRLYVYEKLRRRDTLDDAWRALLKHIALFAKSYGSENARMVVWFIN